MRPDPDREADPAVGSCPSTGDSLVDEALLRLDRMQRQPLARHIEVAEHVRATLAARLSDLGDP